MITVRIGHVNRDAGEYIGRPMRDRPGSPLGNQERIDHPITSRTNRAKCIEKYRAWIWRYVPGDNVVYAEIRRLFALARRPEGVTLTCWCRDTSQTSPACHGDVIKSVLEWMEKTVQESQG